MAEYDKRKARSFLRQLVSVYDRVDARDKAHDELGTQLHKVKTISSSPKIHQPSLAAEIEKLQSSIIQAIEKEKEVIQGMGLNKKAINRLSGRIKQLEKKVGVYTEVDQSRDKRLEKIETKIVGKLDKNEQEIEDLDRRIAELEKLYNEAVNSGKYSAKELRNVKSKIDASKKKLQKRKEDISAAKIEVPQTRSQKVKVKHTKEVTYENKEDALAHYS